MKRPDYYEDDLGYEFNLNDIRNWVLDKCMSSGDPDNFLDCLGIVVEDLSRDTYGLEGVDGA